MNRTRLTIIIVALAMGAFAAPAAAKLTADYHFDGDLKNSHGPANDLSKVGPGGKFTHAQVFGHRDKVWEWPKGTGLRLGKAGKALGNDGETYTFVLLVRLNVCGSYRKLVDFDDRQSDEGWYEYSRSLYPYNLPGFDHSKKKIQPGEWRQIALTRGGGGNVHGYVGKTEIGHDADPDPDVALGPDKILHFLVDNVSGSEDSGGQIARLRIYDSALSAKAIKHLGH
jgi:hypothetical protein